MACGYLGCGTMFNKIAWGIFSLLMLIAAIMIGVGLGRTIPCSRQLVNCVQSNPAYKRDTSVCSGPYRNCARAHIIITALGVLGILIALSLVCAMCCCSKPPSPKLATGQPYGTLTGVQMQPPYPVMGTAAMGGQPNYQQQQQFQQQPYGNPHAGYNDSMQQQQLPGLQQFQQQQPFGVPPTQPGGPFLQGPRQYTVA